MNSDAQRLVSLAKLAAIQRERCLAELAQAITLQAEAEARLKALSDARQKRLSELSRQAEPDVAACSGADTRWQAFAEEEQTRLTTDIAQKAALAAERRDEARVAFGRAEVLWRIAEESSGSETGKD